MHLKQVGHPKMQLIFTAGSSKLSCLCDDHCFNGFILLLHSILLDVPFPSHVQQCNVTTIYTSEGMDATLMLNRGYFHGVLLKQGCENMAKKTMELSEGRGDVAKMKQTCDKVNHK